MNDFPVPFKREASGGVSRSLLLGSELKYSNFPNLFYLFYSIVKDQITAAQKTAAGGFVASPQTILLEYRLAHNRAKGRAASPSKRTNQCAQEPIQRLQYLFPIHFILPFFVLN